MSPETLLSPLLGQTIERIEGAEPDQEVVALDLAEGQFPGPRSILQGQFKLPMAWAINVNDHCSPAL